MTRPSRSGFAVLALVLGLLGSGRCSSAEASGSSHERRLLQTAESCKAGTYFDKATTKCLQCQPGTFSSDAASECMQCKPGTFSSDAASECMQCKANTFSVEGASECTACKADTCSEAGASACTAEACAQAATPTPPATTADCDGKGSVKDACGVCGGDGKSCAGCDGVANSGTKQDACGVCGGDGSSCTGCDGVINSGVKKDACGVCGGDGQSCLDCAGVPNGKKVVDSCGVCGGDSSSCFCNADPRRSCSGKGSCDSAYKCICQKGYSFADCSRKSSATVEFTVAGQVETFKPAEFQQGLATAMAIEPDSVYVKSFKAGSVSVGVDFVDSPACPTCSQSAFQKAQAIIADPTSAPEEMKNLGILTMSTEEQKVSIRGLVLTCDILKTTCKKTLPVKGENKDYWEEGNGQLASFVPQLAGNYTFTVSVTDRCQTLSQIVRVEAVCTNEPPVASFTLQSQYVYTGAGQEIELDGRDSYSPQGGMQLAYLWCLSGPPDGEMHGAKLEDGTRKSNSTKLILGQFKEKTMLAKSVTYTVSLLVTDGCSVGTKTGTVKLICSCPPQVDGGRPKTIRGVSNRGATTLLTLDGSRTFNAEATEALVYEWVLKRRYGLARGIKQEETIVGDKITYTWYQASTTGPSYEDQTPRKLPSAVMNTTSNSTFFPNYGRNVTSVLHTLKSPRTSGFARTTEELIYEQECEVVDKITSVYDYSASPLCTVTLNNRTGARATFQADSYQSCLGDFEIELHVHDGCENVVDRYNVTLACNKKPIALIHCSPWTVWDVNSPSGRFDFVYLDGRVTNFDFKENETTLSMSWQLLSAPTAAASYLERGLMSDTTNTIARLQPDLPGEYVVQLTVDDGCQTSTDSLSIMAVCIDLTPSIGIRSGLVVDTASTKRGLYLQEMQFSAEDTYYGTRGDRNRLRYTYNVVKPQYAPTSLPVANAQGDVATFLPVFSGAYTMQLSVTDDCQTKTTTILFYVACPDSYNIGSPTYTGDVASGKVRTTSDGTLELPYSYTAKQFPSFEVEASYATTHTVGVTYTYRWVVKANGVDQTALSSVSRTNGKFTFAPTAPGTYSIYVQVSDGCQLREFLYLRAVSVSCAPAPKPVISLAAGVTQTGVSSGTTNVTTIDYYNTKDGFHRAVFSCESSVVSSGQYTCKWTPSGSGLSVQYSGKTITVVPTTEGTYSVRLTVDDSCPQPQSTASVVITAKCKGATYSLLAPGATSNADTVINVEDASNVKGVLSVRSEWQPISQSFADVWLNGTISTSVPMNPGDMLTYSWSTVATSAGKGTFLTMDAVPPNQPASGTNKTLVMFKPGPSSGRYEARLTVSDGCKSEVFVFIIDCPCPALSATIEHENGQYANQLSSRWSNDTFPKMDLRGEANLDYSGLRSKLQYTWHMMSAPFNSGWGKTHTNITYPTKPKLTSDTSTAKTISELRLLDPAWGDQNLVLTQLATTTCRIKATNKTTSTLLSLQNAYSMFVYDRLCFVPDVPGVYNIRLTIGDGCSQRETNVTVLALCNGSPNIVFDDRAEDKFVELDGVNTKRVYVNAARTSDPDLDHLTYSWTVFDPMNKEFGAVANKNGNICSFIPTSAGDWRAQLTVSDGCTQVTSVFLVSVNCEASVLRLQGYTEPTTKDGSAVNGVTTVRYLDEGNLVGSFSQVRMGAKISPDCNSITKYSWSLVDMQCTAPAVVAATPAPSSAQSVCTDHVRYEWDVVKKPCTSRVGQESLANAHTKMASFTPDRSGQYILKLTVADSCSDHSANVTVDVSCGVKINLNAGTAVTKLFGCGAGGGFEEATLEGFATVESGRSFINQDSACAPPPRTPTPTVAPTAAPAACCPACDSCRACQTCPGCRQNCNCDTRGWQKVCSDRSVTEYFNVLRTVAVATTCGATGCESVASDQDTCPIPGCSAPQCTCTHELRVVKQGRDVIKNVCEWVPEFNQRGFGAKSHTAKIFDRPDFHVASLDAKRNSPANHLFSAVMSGIGGLLVISIVVNVIYTRKVYRLQQSVVDA